MNSLFNKKDADEIVINNLLHEIARLKGEKLMGKVIKGTDGNFYVVGEENMLTADQVNERINKLQGELADLQLLVAPSEPTVPADTPSVPAQPEQPAESNPQPEQAPPADPNTQPPAPAPAPAPAAPTEPILQ